MRDCVKAGPAGLPNVTAGESLSRNTNQRFETASRQCSLTHKDHCPLSYERSERGLAQARFFARTRRLVERYGRCNTAQFIPSAGRFATRPTGLPAARFGAFERGPATDRVAEE